MNTNPSVRVKRPRSPTHDTAPSDVTAHLSLTPKSFSDARSLWLEAPSLEALVAVEAFYKQKMSELKAKRGGGPLTEEEVDVRNRLIMLLMQSGRWDQCITGLTQLGCKVRLASCVLNYGSEGAGGAASDVLPPCTAADNVVPQAAFEALQQALGPIGASYWVDHGYSVEPPSPYFSYVLPMSPALLHGSDGALGSLGALVQCVYALGVKRFGEEKMCKVKFAELWAHNRPHASGHQLHYDSDDEGRGGIRHPIVSSVLFLQGAVGGPTLVTTQRLADKRLTEHGWLCHPKEGRCLVFDGSVLHGVIPGKGVSPSVGQRRVTVMVALWESIQLRPGEGPGSARPFPKPSATSPKWVKDLTATPSTCASGSSAYQQSSAALDRLPRVWERVDGSAVPSDAPICAYSEVYQGF